MVNAQGVLVVLFLTSMGCFAFGGIMFLVAASSDRPADARYVRPMGVLCACGALMTGLVVWASTL